MKFEKRLTNEQVFFLKTLSDYVNGQKTAVPGELNIPQLVTLSEAQQLSPIMFYQTGLPSLQLAFAAASYHVVNRKKLLEKIDKEFRAGHSHNDSLKAGHPRNDNHTENDDRSALQFDP